MMILGVKLNSGREGFYAHRYITLCIVRCPEVNYDVSLILFL